MIDCFGTQRAGHEIHTGSYSVLEGQLNLMTPHSIYITGSIECTNEWITILDVGVDDRERERKKPLFDCKEYKVNNVLRSLCHCVVFEDLWTYYV